MPDDTKPTMRTIASITMLGPSVDIALMRMHEDCASPRERETWDVAMRLYDLLMSTDAPPSMVREARDALKSVCRPDGEADRAWVLGRAEAMLREAGTTDAKLTGGKPCE